MKINSYVLVFLLSLSLCNCSDNDSNNEPELQLEPVTYQLIYFTFVQETETNEDSLAFQIEFFNSNDVQVTGTPRVTTTIGGDEGTTVTYTPNQECQVMEANSSCILTYYVEDDTPDLYPAGPIEFVSAEYILD